jgi:predicted transposase YbfD/YdcC
MTAMPEATPSPLDLPGHFASLPDPRHPLFRDFHLFGDIIAIALCAVLSGATSWDAVAGFGRRKQQWLSSLGLKLPNGIPSHDTFNRVFAAINPRAFQDCFNGWLCSVCDALGVVHVPIDGKALRGTRGPDGTCLHLVSAWATQARLSLGQVAVEGKSNEITAIPRLLELLDLHGALVTIDAIGCQKEIASGVLAAGGDYLLALKENQPTLHADAVAAFADAEETGFAGVRHDSYVTKEAGHGRQEERRYTVLYDLDGLSTRDDWDGLASVVRVERRRRQGEKESVEVAYYVSSSGAAALVLARGIRLHWGIENGCHWVLDVVFGEDRCRARHGHAAENLAWLRKIVLSLLGQERRKASYRTTLFELAIDDEYRLELLRKLLSQ